MSTPGFPWRSRFTYGTGGDIVNWETTLPTRPWTPVVPTVGGSRTAAGGLPAAYVVRRDYNLRLPLRVYETELPEVHGLIRWGQWAESFLWLPDADRWGTSFEVYLESPLAGESWEPVRDPTFGRVFEVDLVLRNVGTFPWYLDFFRICSGGSIIVG